MSGYTGMNFHSDEYMAILLREKGFVVIPKERLVVLQANYAVPPFELEHSRISAERFSDMVQATALTRLIGQANANGLVQHARQDVDDPVTGREVFFTSAMTVIKPKP